MLGAVDGDFGQIKPDDPVVPVECLVDETVEHPGLPPLVATSSQRRLRTLPETPGDIPRAARHQPEQDRLEAFEVVAAWTVTAQRMLVDHRRQSRFDRRPDSRDNTRMKCEHAGDLHLVVVFWIAP